MSSFQVQIADFDILTAGDSPDCLVAMNPAALKKNLKDLRQGGTLIVNTDAFDERNLAKAGYEGDPLEDGTLDGYRVIKVPMDDLTKEAVKDTGVSGRSVLRSKNFFALGLLAWLFHRPTQPTIDWAQKKFSRTPEVAAANVAAFQAGYTFGEATEAAKITFEVKPAAAAPRHLHQRQWQHRRSPGADRRLQALGTPIVLRHLSDHSGIGHPPRAGASQELRGAHLPGRGRDRRGRKCHRRRLRREPGRHRLIRPRHRAEKRGHLPRLHDGVAPHRHQRPAWRPIDRSAHQARAVRPAVLPVRASRRVSDPGAGDRLAVGRLRADHRGGQDRNQVHDPGPAPQRQPGRKRVRALDAARR